ncbi:MAG: hypothetical protein IKM43_02085 [Clostridia bacterium]|nr:hypothetical protein [Clostridia bacterium]
MEFFKNKICPRCGKKVDKSIVVCPSCQLNYDKFNTATNAEAKQALAQGETDRVLMRTGYPSDVKKWKLILLTIFLGFTGAHYYYVGRKKMGLFFTAFFIVGITHAIITAYVDASPKGDLWQIFTMLTLIWGVVAVLWLADIAKVVFNRFKIPVSRN